MERVPLFRQRGKPRRRKSGAVGDERIEPYRLVSAVQPGEVAFVNSGPEKTRRLRDVLGGDTLVAAYGDTFADLAMLEASASPVAVAPDRALLRVALARRWRIIPH